MIRNEDGMLQWAFISSAEVLKIRKMYLYRSMKLFDIHTSYSVRENI